jgi:hypothetical protein
VTGDDVAAAMQRNAMAAIVNISRVIATVHYHFVIAVWRAKEAQYPSHEQICDHRNYDIRLPPRERVRSGNNQNPTLEQDSSVQHLHRK